MDNYFKKGIGVAVMLLLYIPLCIWITILLFGLINKVDPGIYYRFATDNKYSEDVFFSAEVAKKTAIDKTIERVFELKAEKEPENTQEKFLRLLEDETLLMDQISKNKDFIEYLDNKKLDLSDVITYMKSFIDLDYRLMSASFYFSALIIFIILYWFCSFRIELYLLAGFLYIFSNLNIFTSGMFANIFYPFMHGISKVMREEYTFDQYTMYVNFLPTIKEAFLSYIIFDTVFQVFKESREKRVSKRLTYIYCSIEETLKIMRMISKNSTNLPSIKVSKLKIDFDYLIKFAQKNKKDLDLKEVIALTQHMMNKMESSSVSIYDVVNFLERLELELNKSANFKSKIDSHIREYWLVRAAQRES